jgi:hypothetical protein
MRKPHMQVDRDALIRCRLGLVDAQKFRATPYDYLVILGCIFDSVYTKIGRIWNEIRGLYRVHVPQNGRRG